MIVDTKLPSKDLPRGGVTSVPVAVNARASMIADETGRSDIVAVSSARGAR